MKLEDITYMIPDNGSILPQYIFLDFNDDLSIEKSSNVSDNPIDAIRGSSLKEKIYKEMISLGVSGSFSNRNKGREFVIPNSEILFLNSDNRLESIVEWFEKAIENSTVFTVCKKGVLYHNQLLNSLKWTFDDSASKIGVSLSFIEIELVERASLEGTCTIVIPTNKYVGSSSSIYREIRASSIFSIENNI